MVIFCAVIKITAYAVLIKRRLPSRCHVGVHFLICRIIQKIYQKVNYAPDVYVCQIWFFFSSQSFEFNMNHFTWMKMSKISVQVQWIQYPSSRKNIFELFCLCLCVQLHSSTFRFVIWLRDIISYQCHTLIREYTTRLSFIRGAGKFPLVWDLKICASHTYHISFRETLSKRHAFNGAIQ